MVHQDDTYRAAEGAGAPRWMFDVVRPGSRAQNNSIEKAFKSGPLAFLLVREMTQNVLDAARFDASGRRVTPVLGMRFVRVPLAALESIGFTGIRRHFDACNMRTKPRGTTGGDVNVLLIEDNGTGLEGDFRWNGLPTTSAQRYLYELDSGGGSRGKRGDKGGRHGVGAEMSTLASSYRTTYFHTTRADGSSFASGRASLKNHQIGDTVYLPFGAYSIPDENGIDGPCTGVDAARVASALGFRRRTSAPGLSIAVIDPVAELNIENLIAATVASQFYQIASGALAVEIGGPQDSKVVRLTKDSIRDVVSAPAHRESFARLAKSRAAYRILDDIDQVLDFVASAIAAEVVGAAATEDGNPRFTDDQRADLRAAWFDGRTAAFSLPVAMEHAERGGLAAAAAVALRRTAAGSGGWSILIRDNITIVETAPRGTISLTAAAGNDLSSCLGDCEDPAHQRFQSDQGHDRGWRGVEATIHAFRSAAASARASLLGESSEIDDDALSRFFPLFDADYGAPALDAASPPPAPAAEDEPAPPEAAAEEPADEAQAVEPPADEAPESAAEAPADEDDGPPEDDGPVEVIRGDAFVFEKDASGGFRIRYSEAGKRAVALGGPVDLSVSMAYATLAGKGPSDWVDPANVTCVVEGAESWTPATGRLVIAGADVDLFVHVRGLDVNRDVNVSVNAEHGTAKEVA
jgi:hypothetical protein